MICLETAINCGIFLVQLLVPLFVHMSFCRLHYKIYGTKVKGGWVLLAFVCYSTICDVLIEITKDYAIISCLINYFALFGFLFYSFIFQLDKRIVFCCIVIYNVFSTLFEYIYTFFVLDVFNIANLDYFMEPHMIRLISFFIIFTCKGLTFLALTNLNLDFFMAMKESRVLRLFVMLLVTDFIFSNITMQLDLSNVFNYGTFVTLLCEFIFILIAIRCIYISIHKEQEIKLHLDNATSQIEMYEKNQKANVQADKMIHDMKNHLLSIGHLLKSQKYDLAYDYISQMMPELNAAKTEAAPQSILHTFLYRKQQDALKYNVSFSYIISVKDVTLPIMDLSTLIFNMSDNAIEYCRNHHYGESGVNYRIFLEHKSLVFECFNRCDEAPKQDKQGNFITSKKNKKGHGLGISILHDCAKRNGGCISTQFIQGLFIISAQFPESLAIKHTMDDIRNPLSHTD